MSSLHPYYLVGGRPVKFVFDDDGMDVLAYQWDTGEFIRDLKYTEICLDPTNPEVEEVDGETFESAVAMLEAERKSS